jgi:hypothetical protein
MLRMRAPTSIRTWLADRRLPRHLGREDGPGHALEQRQQATGCEPRAGDLDVAVAHGRLPMGEEAVRCDQVQHILGPRHGDVK